MQYSNRSGTKRKSLFTFCIGIIAAMCVSCGYLDFATRHNLTSSELWVIGLQIETYYEETNALPQELADIKIFEEKDRSYNDQDAWGRPYVWSKHGETGIRIVSYGKDGKVGGEKEDQDLEVTFDYSREKPLKQIPKPVRFYSRVPDSGPIQSPQTTDF